LFGSRTTTYRVAISWATATTLAGSICSIFLAQTLIAQFSGKGIVPDALVGSEPFLLAVALGTGLTVILATRLGFPVSTTHGLTGAIIGSGVVAVGDQVAFAALGKQFFLPLVLSPILAIVIGAVLYAVFHFARVWLSIEKGTCVCVGNEVQWVAQPQLVTALAAPQARIAVVVDDETHCAERYIGKFFGINCQHAMDAAHFLSAGIVSFARGLNDTPKIAALLLAARALELRGGLLLVAVTMAVGGYWVRAGSPKP